MPNFNNGEGRCSCPSGQQAGLGDYHRDNAPGCISGPEEFVGKKTVTETWEVGKLGPSELAPNAPKPNKRSRWQGGDGSRSTQPVKPEEKKSLFRSLYEQADELLKFVITYARVESHNKVRFEKMKKELGDVLSEVDNLVETPIDDLITASSLGDEEAVAARESVPQEVVDNILRRADELEAEQREAQQVPGAVYVGYVGPGVHAITFNSAEERNRWAKIIHKAQQQNLSSTAVVAAAERAATDPGKLDSVKTVDQIVKWLQGLESARSRVLDLNISDEERATMVARRGLYSGIADDIKAKWGTTHANIGAGGGDDKDFEYCEPCGIRYLRWIEGDVNAATDEWKCEARRLLGVARGALDEIADNAGSMREHEIYAEAKKALDATVCGECPEHMKKLEVQHATQEDVPITNDFWAGVKEEMAYQVKRWGTTHDERKDPENWFWLLGYLAGKALASVRKGDKNKALHHCISSAAVLGHWHEAIKTRMPSLKVEHDPSKELGEETP